MVRRALVAAVLSTALLVAGAPTVSADTSRSRGIASMPSTSYWGKYYDARSERARKCILYRESRGKYGIVNRRSGAAGGYQFMRRTSNAVAKMMGRRDLIGVPANRWSKKTQDRAFFTLYNHGRGRSHWAGGSFPC